MTVLQALTLGQDDSIMLGLMARQMAGCPDHLIFNHQIVK
jgi:hypothetical protein